MYRAFELSLDEGIRREEFFSECMKIGKSDLESEEKSVRSLLRDVMWNGTIDGTSLIDSYFPTFHKDVFLSYSHDDQDVAYMVAGLLTGCFGLKVFMDSMFWGSADALLQEIDDEYCSQEKSNTYSYWKRNLSTSHVHAMLTSAIMRAMDQAEAVIFLNTPHSAPSIGDAIAHGGYGDYTMSPWIYEEMLLTTVLREVDWREYRREWRLDEGALEHFEKSLKVAYKLPKERLIPLTLDDIMEWHGRLEERRKRGGVYGGGLLGLKPEDHPLNVLYEIKCGVIGAGEVLG